MRRWHPMVNFTGSGHGSLCWPCYLPEFVRLTMRFHLRICMGTWRRTIYTTLVMTHTYGLTITLITLKFSADFNFEPFVIFNPLSYCWAHGWAKCYWDPWYGRRTSWCTGLVCWWRYLNVVDVIWRRTYVPDSSVGIGIFSYGSFEGIVWHAFQFRRFI